MKGKSPGHAGTAGPDPKTKTSPSSNVIRGYTLDDEHLRKWFLMEWMYTAEKDDATAECKTCAFHFESLVRPIKPLVHIIR